MAIVNNGTAIYDDDIINTIMDAIVTEFDSYGIFTSVTKTEPHKTEDSDLPIAFVDYGGAEHFQDGQELVTTRDFFVNCLTGRVIATKDTQQDKHNQAITLVNEIPTLIMINDRLSKTRFVDSVTIRDDEGTGVGGFDTSRYTGAQFTLKVTYRFKIK